MCVGLMQSKFDESLETKIKSILLSMIILQMHVIYSSEPIFTCIWYLLCAIFGSNLIEDVE